MTTARTLALRHMGVHVVEKMCRVTIHMPVGDTGLEHVLPAYAKVYVQLKL